MLRFLTAGESHGPAVVTILDGLPAGLAVDRDWLDHQLARRQAGYGRGGRMKIESDRATVLGGLRFGRTLGSPVAIVIANRDHANWAAVMAVWGGPPADLARVTCPRPGHADLAGAAKYGHSDLRDAIERASARETAGRVAAGALAKLLLLELGIWVGGQVLAVGDAAAPADVPRPAGTVADHLAWQEAVDGSALRCACPAATARMVAAVDAAAAAGHSLGGVFEVLTNPPPPGLGSYAQWDRRLDAALAGGLSSIPGVKGVEVGAGFAAAALPGDLAHDELYPTAAGLGRRTNRAGGLAGGVTNGAPLVLRCAMKPIATQSRPLDTVDLATGRPAAAHRERADTCAVPSAAVVGEAMVALALADAVLAKFGGDNVAAVRRNLAAYLDEPLPARLTGAGPAAVPADEGGTVR